MAAANILLFASAAILILGLSLEYRDRARNSPCSFVGGVIFFTLFVLIPLLSNLFYGPALGVGWQPRPILSGGIYRIYGICVVLIALGFFFTSIPLTPRNKPRHAPGGKSISPIRKQHERCMLWVLGAMVIGGVVLYMVGTGLSLRQMLTAGRFAHFRYDTAEGTAILLGQYMVGLIAVYSYYDAKQGFPRRLLSLAVYSAVVAIMVLAGGRKWIIFIASGLLAGSYQRQGVLRINTRIIAGVLAGIVLLVGWQAVRAIGWADPRFLYALSGELGNRLPRLLWEGDATYFFRSSLESIRVTIAEGVRYPFAIVRRLLLLPFPSEWTLGWKPEGIPFLFADQLSFYSGARRGNLPPGFLGLFVLSFGWKVGILIAPIAAVSAVRLADRLVVGYSGWLRDAAFSSYVVAITLLMRGSEGGLYFLIFNVVVVGSIGVLFSIVTVAVNRARSLMQSSSRPLRPPIIA